MSGHNKWSKIKHKKAATDAARSKIFGKLGQFITIESRKAGGDTSAPGLSAAINKAKSLNMPMDNIDRAVKRGTGSDAASLEQITYEAYGPGGVALIIEALTDNKNRAAAEIKHILSKHGASLAAPGAASWAFEKTSEGWTPKNSLEITEKDGEKLVALLEELEDNNEVQEVNTNAN